MGNNSVCTCSIYNRQEKKIVMEYKSFKTFNQDYLNTLKELEYRERFLALYPYLKDYLMPAMRYKRFGNVDHFDWEDACSAVYYNIFILCSNSDWLSKHPNQVKRFLYVVCQNSVLRQLQLLNRYRSRNVSIDSIENFEGILDVIPDTNNKINIIDVVEVNGLTGEGAIDIIEFIKKTPNIKNIILFLFFVGLYSINFNSSIFYHVCCLHIKCKVAPLPVIVIL